MLVDKQQYSHSKHPFELWSSSFAWTVKSTRTKIIVNMNRLRTGINQLGEQIKRRYDPISRYNKVVENYNDPINREKEIYLKKACSVFFYRCWIILQLKIVLCFLFIYVIPYLNVLTFLMNLLTLIVQESAIRVANSNQRRMEDPFQHMVYSPIMCERYSAPYLYFEVDEEQLESFRFLPEVKANLKARQRNYEGKIMFMVYNNEFLAWYHNIKKSRCICLTHLILNLTLFLIMQYFVYDYFLCLDLISPIDSTSNCSHG